MKMFKKGDIVRCIDVHDPKNDDVKKLILNEIYLVDEDATIENVSICRYFGKFAYKGNKLSGFFPKRFKKISKKDLTKEEIFELTKYKLGIKGDYYGKEEKRTERT